jgi:hypothetical protein
LKLDFGSGQEPSGQVRDDAPLVHDSYFLIREYTFLGNGYGPLVRNVSGQVREDNFLVHTDYSLKGAGTGRRNSPSGAGDSAGESVGRNVEYPIFNAQYSMGKNEYETGIKEQTIGVETIPLLTRRGCEGSGAGRGGRIVSRSSATAVTNRRTQRKNKRAATKKMEQKINPISLATGKGTVANNSKQRSAYET